MHTAEEIEREILNLPPAEYTKLRAWFLEQDARAWDSQFEKDALSGKLDALAAAARRAHATGKSTRL